jgi:hypothetical protein
MNGWMRFTRVYAGCGVWGMARDSRPSGLLHSCIIPDFLTDDEPVAEFNSDACVQQGREYTGTGYIASRYATISPFTFSAGALPLSFLMLAPTRNITAFVFPFL